MVPLLQGVGVGRSGRGGSGGERGEGGCVSGVGRGRGRGDGGLFRLEADFGHNLDRRETRSAFKRELGKGREKMRT